MCIRDSISIVHLRGCEFSTTATSSSPKRTSRPSVEERLVTTRAAPPGTASASCPRAAPSPPSASPPPT
eukprot:5037941-Prymnesium_polylepis.1